MADDTDTAPRNISTKKKTRRHSQADVAAAAKEHVALVDRRRNAQTTTEEPDEGKDQKQNNGSCNDKDKRNLAASMLGGKVEMIEVKTEDGGTKLCPSSEKACRFHTSQRMV